MNPVPRLRALFPAGQVIRFGVTGILATATHYAVLRFGVETLGIHPALATVSAFCLAVMASCIGQSHWVFRRKLDNARGLGRFLATATGGLLANVAIMFAAVDLLGLHYLAGFLTALFVVPAGTFAAGRFWVFAETGG